MLNGDLSAKESIQLFLGQARLR